MSMVGYVVEDDMVGGCVFIESKPQLQALIGRVCAMAGLRLSWMLQQETGEMAAADGDAEWWLMVD